MFNKWSNLNALPYQLFKEVVPIIVFLTFLVFCNGYVWPENQKQEFTDAKMYPIYELKKGPVFAFFPFNVLNHKNLSGHFLCDTD